MNAQKWIWWIVFLTTVIATGFILTGMVVWALLPKIPEEVVFVLGLVMFYLFAHRLIFGYGAMMDFATLSEAQQGEARERATERSGLWWEMVREWTLAAILWEWAARLDPYKYAYYMMYFFTVLLYVITELNLLGFFAWRPLFEALFWGASIPTLFVLAYDTVARWYLRRLVLEG